jgi:nucleoside-diphosphate-sugar epimerase
MRILITGGTGFIGSELLSRLIQDTDYELYSLHRRHIKKSGYIESTKRHHIKEGDITKYSDVKKIIKEIQPEIVVHLAALSSVAASYNNPLDYVSTNLIGTINLAEACLKEVKNLKRMLFASSLHVYKDTPKVLQTEDKTPEEPNSPYGITKLAAEKYLLSLFRSYEFPVHILRISNIYGRKKGFSHSIVELLIIQMLKNRIKLDLGSPDPVRDFLYISDVVEACIKLIESTKVNPGQIFNISSSNPMNIVELADRIVSRTKFKNKINWDSNLITPRPGDPEWLVADNMKARKLLNWEPKVSLDEGIQKTIANYT